MKILTKWLRSYLPELPVDDLKLAEDLTLRGIAVEGIYDLGPGNGSLYEMDITTNRVDAMNHYGVAREAVAIYGVALKLPEFPLPEPRAATKPFSVAIEADDVCGRFTARVLRDIVIGESRDLPEAAIVTYFKLLEQKQILNAVDATNFAWLAMGQPTHAFDLDKLQGGIIVRRARKGEKLRTLDGVERGLDPDDLVVADHAKPVGLAGVMGGWDTMITPETKNVLVEAAWFDPMAVRRTARRHGLHTDASHRFERGADINAAPVASALVSSILLANGGWPEGELVDVRVPAIEARTAHREAVVLALSEVQRILGRTIDPDGITAATVENVLNALGCQLTPQRDHANGEAWFVMLPSWRLDLQRDIDLIEEVARVYGYNRFANTLPAFGEGVRALPWADAETAVRRTMLAAGFHEAISSTFCSAADAALTAPQPGLTVPLGNPLSEEAGACAWLADSGCRKPSSRRERCAAIRTGHGVLRLNGEGRGAARIGVRRSGVRTGAGCAPSTARSGVLRHQGSGGTGACPFPIRQRVLRSLLGGRRTHARVAASLSLGARGHGWSDRGLVRSVASAPSRGAQAAGDGVRGRNLSRPPLQAAVAQTRRAGALAFPARTPRLLTGTR